MAVETIKSASITSLDATPPFPPTTGEGSKGYLNQVDGVAPVAAGSSATSTYRLARIPFAAKLKQLDVYVDAAPGAGAVNVGAAYSDKIGDGTPSALSGTLIDADVFAAAITLGAANVRVDGLTAYSSTKRQQELWEALGLTANPGGFADILLTVSTAVTNALNVSADVRYVL